MMHRWAVTVAVKSRRRTFSQAVSKLLSAELAHLDIHVDVTDSPTKIELAVLAPEPTAAFLYAQQRLLRVLLPVWTADFSIELISVTADLTSP